VEAAIDLHHHIGDLLREICPGRLSNLRLARLLRGEGPTGKQRRTPAAKASREDSDTMRTSGGRVCWAVDNIVCRTGVPVYVFGIGSKV
jgi:hypothetical protein